MLYRCLLKLKEDMQSINDLKAAHCYLCALENTPALHQQVLQCVFANFGNYYTLLDFYNIAEKLEVAHAHHEANTIRPPRPQHQNSLAAPARGFNLQ
jgi:hypothetical protein